MSDLPTGTITFLFTDIEGSTGLWQRHRDAMPAALARHHAILQNAIESHNGYVFQIIGDAFCAAFFTPSDALSATIDAQRALSAEKWDTTGALRVRMGLHTGVTEAHLDDVKAGQYASGLTLSRAQRIMSAGYGGQILVSSTTCELLRGLLPDGVTLRDLSEHRLKGLRNPEHLWQVVAPDLQHEFPPLQSLNAIPNNLPMQWTSFIGREKEIAQVKQLLTGTGGVTPPLRRLVTLTGSGGVGKTRLAIQVGHQVLPLYPHGVWLVELAPLADPELVPGAVATVLGVRDSQDRPVLTALTDYLREKAALLVLDNCEHVIDACAQLAEHLLQQCPGLRILASSREALGMDGEAALRVPSLSLPAAERARRETMEQSEAVRLFVERAAAALPGFELTDANAPAIAQICRRLDGIALAIELAAARVKVLQVEQIAARLDDAFRLLTGGSRTALPRQQTLRATIDWSYNLLAKDERTVLRRLSVFAGGWTLEAAEAVCAQVGQDGILPYDVLELLTQLVNKSLVVVQREEGEVVRYHLLETTRQYAREKLAESGEGEAVRGRHLDYYMEMAERIELQLRTLEQVAALKQAKAEMGNVRAALDWSFAEAKTTEVEKGLRLVSALEDIWEQTFRMMTEGAEWTQKGLALLATDSKLERALIRAKALRVAGTFAVNEGMVNKGRAMIEESVVLYRAINLTDRRDLVYALIQLSSAWVHIDLATARTLTEESVAIGRELGSADKWHLAVAFYMDGWVAMRQGDFQAARSHGQEALALARQVGDRWMAATAIRLLGTVTERQGNTLAARSFYQEVLRGFQLEVEWKIWAMYATMDIARLDYATGDYESARVCFEETLAYFRDAGDKWANGSLRELGMTMLRLGDIQQAAHLLREDLLQSRERQTDRFALMSIAAWAALFQVRGELERAAVLLGVVESEADRPRNWWPTFQSDYDQTLADTRAALGEEAFAAALAEGRGMTIEQAVVYVLEETG